MTTEPLRRLAISLCALALVAAACGGDDDDSAEAGDDPVATEDSAATEGGASTGTGETDDDGDDADEASGDDVTDETGPTDGSGETGAAGSTTDGDATDDDAADASTTTAAGGASSAFTMEPGEKAIPSESLVYVRPVPGAVYEYQSSAELGGGTITYTVAGVTENAGGLDVDVDLTGSFDTGEVEIGYLFRYLADGTIEIPFVDFSSLGSSAGAGITFIQQPNFVLLDRPAVDSGSDFTGTTTAIIEIAGQRVEVVYDFVGRGLAPETVTVPAGTFTATPIQFDVSFTISGPVETTVAIQSTYYLDPTIGLVRSTFNSGDIGSGSTDLVSCSLL
jgi:hypothetical protein